MGGYAGLDPEAPEPIAALAGLEFTGPPCPTRSSDAELRMAHLAGLAHRAQVRGVLVHTVKFCEPELFDVPALKRTFAALGLPARKPTWLTRLDSYIEFPPVYCNGQLFVNSAAGTTYAFDALTGERQAYRLWYMPLLNRVKRNRL